MRRADAWREIARRLADPSYVLSAGLCTEVYQCYVESTISWTTKERMYAQITRWLPLNTFAWAPGRYRQCRVLAALFLACEAETDAA